MTPRRWRRITEIFHAAVARDVAARGPLLDEACAGDPELRAEVDGMLAAHRDASAFGNVPLVPPEEPPRLEPGATVGPYRVEKLIGSGGMGEVYRARDERLGREVAIKVLPAASVDPDRVRRFDREARAAGALNHPNLLTVFDAGAHDGVPYLVFELLDGMTLREALREPLVLRKAVDYAVQIARGLAAAHDTGIIHRDLKPENLFVTKDGRVKILDFGLAKLRPALDPPPPAKNGGPVSAITIGGVVLGTAGYMSPEQVKGERADHRSDIFAFGCVVYEMLAGTRAFQAATTVETLTAILREEPPPLAAIRSDVPAALERVVWRCLEKRPEERFQSARDLAFGLETLSGVSTDARVATAGRVSHDAAAARRARTRRLAWVAAAGLGGVGIVFGLAARRSERPSPQLVHSALPAPRGVLLSPRAGFALSPNGQRLAFVARDADGVSKLWLRPLAALQARPLAGTDGAEGVAPFWSPDGRDIGFFAGQKLKRVPAAGGAVQVLAGPAAEPKGGAWSHDGRIVYVPDYRTGLFEVPANGGEARKLTALDAAAGEVSHRWPQFLPDGRTLLFLVQTAEAGADDDRSRLEAMDPSGARHEILKVNASAAYVPPGRLLFWRDGSVYAQELDPKSLRLLGEAQLVAEGVDLNLNEWASFTVSDEGSLVYGSALPWRLEWRERSGKLLSVAAPEGRYSYPSLSPDGGRVAYVADNITVWVLDMARGTKTRLTFEDVDHYAPTWAPRGDWVAYAANRSEGPGGEIRRRRSSGLGDEEVLYTSRNVARNMSWSPDGRSIAFEEGDDIFILDLESRAARTRVRTPRFDGYPRFSPDGRWLAYTSDESGRDEVYVVPGFDGPGKWQVTSRGGLEPRWGPSGKELFFLGADHRLEVATAALGKQPEFGLPESLFAIPGAKPGTAYDVGPDHRILVRAQLSEADSESLTLVLNWPRLLEQPSR